MKNRYLLRGGILIFFISVVFSCSKDENNSYSYFVSKEQKTTFTQKYVSDFLDGAKLLFPEAGSLKEHILNDVKIYKLIYRTTISGDEINASGLLCIPSVPGTYPVLSFQNGTNTLNSQAPSNKVAELSYQLVELISSMGFIVVIADYPGFGESSKIPHPYLIKDETVRSLIDMFYAIREIDGEGLEGVIAENEFYLLGYSQGGWATLALHETMERDYSSDFNVAGSACGAGPYNIFSIFQIMVLAGTYPMPAYLGYILNAYSWYGEFNNPVTDILNDPYAGRITSLYTGIMSLSQINDQLTTSIPGLLKKEFISGFQSDVKYVHVREALIRNSVPGWKTNKPLYLLHGAEDTQVSPSATNFMYDSMINAGTSPQLIKKEILPGLDHGEGVVPIMIKGLLFLKDIEDQSN